MAGRADVQIVIAGDSSGLTRAINDSKKSLSSLQKTSATAGAAAGLEKTKTASAALAVALRSLQKNMQDFKRSSSGVGASAAGGVGALTRSINQSRASLTQAGSAISDFNKAVGRTAEGAAAVSKVKNSMQSLARVVRSADGAIRGLQKNDPLKKFEASVGRSLGRIKKDFLDAAAAGKSLSERLKIRASIEGLNTSAAAASINKFESSVENLRRKFISLGFSAEAAADIIRGTSSRMAASTAQMAQSAGAMRFNVAGMTAQFQDIGVTAAMGMAPMMIALQQGTQIAYQLQAAGASAGSALGILRMAFVSLLSPLSLASIGLTAGVVALIQNVEWTNLASNASHLLSSNFNVLTKSALALAAAIGAVKLQSFIAASGGAVVALKSLSSAVAGIGAIAAGGLGFAALSARIAKAARTIYTALKFLAAPTVVGGLVAVSLTVLELSGAFNVLGGWIKRAAGWFVSLLPEKVVNWITASLRKIKDSFSSFFKSDQFLQNFERIKGLRERDSARAIKDIESKFRVQKQYLTGIEEISRAEISTIRQKYSILLKDQDSFIESFRKKLNDDDISSSLAAVVEGQLSDSIFKRKDLLRDLSNEIAESEASTARAVSQRADSLARAFRSANQSFNELRRQVSSQKIKILGLDDEVESARKLFEIERDRVENLKKLDEVQRVIGNSSSIRNLREDILLVSDTSASAAREAQAAMGSTFGKLTHGLTEGVGQFVEDSGNLVSSAASLTVGLLENFTDRFARFLSGGKDAFKDFTSYILSQLAAMAAKWAATKFLSGIAGSLFSPLAGLASFFGFENGGAFKSGSVLKFANGGAFDGAGVKKYARGGVVDRPTNFDVGLMGEAGPEAIMPLRRLSNGKLGVQAEAAPQKITVNIINNSSAQLRGRVEQSDGPLRERVVSVILDDFDRGGPISRVAGGRYSYA